MSAVVVINADPNIRDADGLTALHSCAGVPVPPSHHIAILIPKLFVGAVKIYHGRERFKRLRHRLLSTIAAAYRSLQRFHCQRASLSACAASLSIFAKSA